MNWTTEGVYLTFLRGCSIQEGDLFKRVVISRAYGILPAAVLDSVAEAQRVQVSTRLAAVNSSQPKGSQDCLNVST